MNERRAELEPAHREVPGERGPDGQASGKVSPSRTGFSGTEPARNLRFAPYSEGPPPPGHIPKLRVAGSNPVSHGTHLSEFDVSSPLTVESVSALIGRRLTEVTWFVRGLDAGGNAPAEFGDEGQRLLQGIAEGSAFLTGYQDSPGQDASSHRPRAPGSREVDPRPHEHPRVPD